MSKISELVAYAKENPTGYAEINFGNVYNFQAQSIAQETGVNIRGTKKVLTTAGILHALNGHGDDEQERKRGQIGIKDEDFELIPEILKNADSFKRGNPSSNGRSTNAVVFIKKIKGYLYHVVARIEKDNLVFTTMYIIK